MGCIQTKHLYKEDSKVWYDSMPKLQDDYTVSDHIGAGRYSTVRLVTCKKTSNVYAGKCFEKRISISDGNEIFAAPSVKKLETEISILRDLGAHPNCVAMKGLLEIPAQLFVLLEYCKMGDLMHHLDSMKHEFTEDDAAGYVQDILTGVAHCHSLTIMHRDIKPENMLVQAEPSRRSGGRAMLCDFGSAVRFEAGKPRRDAEESTRSTRFFKQRGSPFWSSPETWRLDYDYRADVWSCGVVALFMVAGDISSNEIELLHYEGVAAVITRRNLYSKRVIIVSAELVALLAQLLQSEEKRIEASAALRCDWLLKCEATRALRLALQTLFDCNERDVLKAALLRLAPISLVVPDDALANPTDSPAPSATRSLADEGDTEFKFVSLYRLATALGTMDDSLGKTKVSAMIDGLKLPVDTVINSPFALESLYPQDPPAFRPVRRSMY